MAWQDKLRPASFRGVQFKVESHDTSGGRRTVKHEFPLRDKPFVEDMGRRAKEFSVDAYVIGDDYFAQRDRLMRACDEAGSADLIHPYLGTLKVVCTGWTLRESKDEGRMARFNLSFVESGEADFPSDSADPLSGAIAAAGLAKEASIANFAEMFSIDGLPDFAVDDAQAMLVDAASQIGNVARTVTTLASGNSGFLGSLGTFVSSIGSLMGSPAILAREMYTQFESLSSLFDSSRLALRGLSGFSDFGSDYKSFAVTTSTRQRQQNNRNAISGLVQQAALIEAARIAPSATYETTNDAQSVRDGIVDQIDTLMENPATSDDVFVTLQDVRTAVVRGVPPESMALPDLVTITPNATVPSVVLAYDTYEDANREAEIVSLNQLKYAGFVPAAEPLQVISNA